MAGRDARDIVVSRFDLAEAQAKPDTMPSTELVSYVMGHVNQWRTVRDTAHKAKWDHWFAVWMGTWVDTMRSRKSERSKIISPGSQMAVDLTVAEIVEGTFSHKYFFGLDDDATDEERNAAAATRRLLTEDMYREGIVDSYNEAALNGALYGTGILKLVMDTEIVRTVQRSPVMDGDRDTGVTKLEVIESEEVVFKYVAIEPGQFVPDPAAGRDIDSMLGCAHEFRMPLHKIKQRQRDGVYFRAANPSPAPAGTDQESPVLSRKIEQDHVNAQYAMITEWYGLVPAKLLGAIPMQALDMNAAKAIANGEDETLVEAIVTIANGGELLRAIAAPTIMKDRPIVSWQHDTVPNSFWGRGVMQKAHNVQSATDAEMRARVDNLTWVSNPMLAVKATAMMPGGNMNIWPGKVWAMREDVNQTLREFKFGEINGSSFNQTAELAQWMSQATGTVDTVGARQNVRDEATGAAAIQQSGFLKRARRTMYNIEQAMTTLVRRTLQRKMEFDEERYPTDFEFVVSGTTGLMARELERQQYIAALQFLEQGSPEQLLMLKKIFEASTSDDKAELVAVISQRMQGPSPEEQEAAKRARDIAEENAQLTNMKLKAEVRTEQAKTLKLAADAGVAEAKETLTRVQAEVAQDQAVLDIARVRVDQSEVVNQQEQLRLQDRSLDIEDRKVSAMENKRPPSA